MTNDLKTAFLLQCGNIPIAVHLSRKTAEDEIIRRLRENIPESLTDTIEEPDEERQIYLDELAKRMKLLFDDGWKLTIENVNSLILRFSLIEYANKGRIIFTRDDWYINIRLEESSDNWRNWVTVCTMLEIPLLD